MKRGNFWQRLLRRIFFFDKEGEIDFITNQKVLDVIINLDVRDIKKRCANSWDKSFLDLIDVWHNYEEGLLFVNTFEYVMDTYFEQVEKKKLYLDKGFQMSICKYEFNPYYRTWPPKYGNLLHRFALRWDLSPEVL